MPVTSGPSSALASVPGAIVSAAMRGLSLAISSSAVLLPTATATEMAMQRSPAEP